MGKKKKAYMISAIIVDFSRVLLFPKNEKYKDGLNSLHKRLLSSIGYHPNDYFDFNEELFNFLLQKRNKYKVYIFTSGLLQNTIGIKERLSTFDGIFSAGELGLNKSESNAYVLIAKKIGIQPNEIIFIDDKEENISAARMAGLRVIQFIDNKQFFKDFERLDGL